MASSRSRLKKRSSRRLQILIRRAKKHNRPGLAEAVKLTGESPETLIASYDAMMSKVKSPEEMMGIMEASGKLAPAEERAKHGGGDHEHDCALCEALVRSGHNPEDSIIRFDVPQNMQLSL